MSKALDVVKLCTVYPAVCALIAADRATLGRGIPNMLCNVPRSLDEIIKNPKYIFGLIAASPASGIDGSRAVFKDMKSELGTNAEPDKNATVLKATFTYEEGSVTRSISVFIKLPTGRPVAVWIKALGSAFAPDHREVAFYSEVAPVAPISAPRNYFAAIENDSTDFVIVMARTGEGKRHEGVTAFIVDKGTKGFETLRDIPMLAGHRTYELVFEDCRIPGKQLLGEIGGGFAPMQLRLIVRRLQIGAWCLGMCRRALQMMVEHAKQRVTFGQKLADRQAIQWWIADAAMKMHACRLMVMDAARKQDEGKDVRNEASMIKVYATEMASEIIDHAMQTFGAMGVTKELPLHLMAQRVRVMRVYEGPTEVHLMAIARKVLKDAK